jgi:SPOR domain
MGVVHIAFFRHQGKRTMIFSSIKFWVSTLVLATLFNACALNSNRSNSSYGYEPEAEVKQKPVVMSQPEKRQYPGGSPTDLAIDAKPHVLPEVKQAATPGIADKEAASTPAVVGGPWRIQVGTLPDLESAQTRKRQLDAKLGSPVDLTFDAPYYKLRWGGFATKQEAEDKLLEMSEIFHEAFVIRQ